MRTYGTLILLDRSCAALSGVLLSAATYVTTDTTLGVEGAAGWTWLLLWWVLLAFQMTYGKHITEAVVMTESERVFYTNVLSVPPTMVLCLLMGEHQDLQTCAICSLCSVTPH